MEDKNTTKYYCGHTRYCDCDPLVSKQTAVEWLFEKINDLLIDFTEGKISAAVYGIRATQFKYKAKEMENSKAFEIFKAGQNSMEEGGKGFEQYYNETYNK